MRKFILIFGAIMGGFFLSQAQNYAGSWAGYITQESDMALANNYYFSLSLEVNGNQITGTSEIRMWDDASITGIMDLSGTFVGSKLAIQETKIIKQEIYTFAYWCLKLLKMEYSIKEGKEILTGHWESDVCSGPGTIYLERAPSA